jgi:hypothetical protein
MVLFPRTPKLESRNCLGLESWVGVLGFWELISFDCRDQSRQGLNQSCISPWELFNVMLHSRIGCRKKVDSQLLVVGSQTGSLTPGPSFARNLGYRCPNGSCNAILDIYTLKPLQ